LEHQGIRIDFFGQIGASSAVIYIHTQGQFDVLMIYLLFFLHFTHLPWPWRTGRHFFVSTSIFPSGRSTRTKTNFNNLFHSLSLNSNVSPLYATISFHDRSPDSELFYDRGNHYQFLTLTSELAPAGILEGDKEFEFDFVSAEKTFESYNGINARLRSVQALQQKTFPIPVSNLNFLVALSVSVRFADASIDRCIFPDISCALLSFAVSWPILQRRRISGSSTIRILRMLISPSRWKLVLRIVYISNLSI
jgi:hypothetical protein